MDPESGAAALSAPDMDEPMQLDAAYADGSAVSDFVPEPVVCAARRYYQQVSETLAAIIRGRIRSSIN